MRDAPHCLGFLDMLVVDLLLLTAESRGQLGLTRSNPLGHLEPPPPSPAAARLTRIIPHASYTRAAHILRASEVVSAPLSMYPPPPPPSLMPVDHDADVVNAIR